MNNKNITRKKKKKAWLGLGREKINLKDVLERLLELPDESIKVYDVNDWDYKKMRDLEERRKRALEGRKSFNNNKSLIQPVIQNNVDGQKDEQKDGQKDGQNDEQKDGQKDGQKDVDDSVDPIPTAFDFDSSINSDDQTKIKGVMIDLNTILRLPELNLFSSNANKEIIEGNTEFVTVIERTKYGDGSVKESSPQEVMVPPFINIESK